MGTMCKRNPKTRLKTKLHWKKFYSFYRSNRADVTIEGVPAVQLEKVLHNLPKDRKQNGGDYELDLVSTLQKSIQHHQAVLQYIERLHVLEVDEADEKMAVKRSRWIRSGACLD